MERIDVKQLELNPFSVISDDAFLLTAGEAMNYNTMAAGWGGFGYLWNKPVVYVFVRESRHTLSFLESSPRFSASFFPPEYRKAIDHCGSVSGRTESKKAENAGLHPIEIGGTVAFEEANLVYACRKLSKVFIGEKDILDSDALRNYPNGDWHYMYIGEVEGVYIS